MTASCPDVQVVCCPGSNRLIDFEELGLRAKIDLTACLSQNPVAGLGGFDPSPRPDFQEISCPIERAVRQRARKPERQFARYRRVRIPLHGFDINALQSVFYFVAVRIAAGAGLPMRTTYAGKVSGFLIKAGAPARRRGVFGGIRRARLEAAVGIAATVAVA